MYTLYNCCEVSCLVTRDTWGETGSYRHGDSWIIIARANGTWVPLTRLFQDSSFHFILNLFHFFFFSRKSRLRIAWDPWNLTQESTHWIFWFETGFIISRDLFNIYRYWFCLFRVFEGIFSHHQLGTKNVPEIRLKIRISWQKNSPIHNLTSLRSSLNPVMFKFGIFPLNFKLSSSTLSFQDHTLWFFVWHVIISRE